MLEPLPDGVVEHPQLQRRPPVLRVDDNKVPLGVEHAPALVVAQPPDLRRLGLLPVLLRHRVLSGRDEELAHIEGPVPGEGDLLGGRIVEGEEPVPVDGVVEVPSGLLVAPGGEVHRGLDHPGAGALGQALSVDARHVPVHQLSEGRTLRPEAAGVHVGDVVGLYVHAQLLLVGAHRRAVKGHIHGAITPFSRSGGLIVCRYLWRSW